MTSRVSIVFWATTAAAVLLLGSVWALAGRVGSSDAGPQDYILMVVAGVGFLATAFVSARIVFVVGRLKKRARQEEATHAPAVAPRAAAASGSR